MPRSLGPETAAPDRFGAASDAAVLARVAAGDPVACRFVVTRHLPRVVGLARRMLDDAALADDIAQECFVRLWAQARRWRPDARVSTWLYRVAHNLCLDELRRRRRYDDTAPETVFDRPDDAPGPAEWYHRTECAARVGREIRALPERQRTAITLVHHHELGNVEAAAIMGVSVEALESLLARGRRRLRNRLADFKDEVLGDELKGDAP